MVKHMIVWQLKDELSEDQKTLVKQEIKEGLENLYGIIPGLVYIKVNINPLSTSNADLILDSCFSDETAYSGYITHPEHVAVANEKVRPNVKTRLCIDYEE